MKHDFIFTFISTSEDKIIDSNERTEIKIHSCMRCKSNLRQTFSLRWQIDSKDIKKIDAQIYNLIIHVIHVIHVS